MPKKLGITISPPHRPNNHKSYNVYKDYYIDDYLYIRVIMEKYKNPNYIFYPELDPKGRLHYHGIITLQNDTQEVTFYKCIKNKLSKIGFIDVTLLKDFVSTLRWLHYCKKDWGKTKEIIDLKHPILLPKRLSLTKKEIKDQKVEEKLKNILDYFKETTQSE